jgi:hypothetical protein
VEVYLVRGTVEAPFGFGANLGNYLRIEKNGTSKISTEPFNDQALSVLISGSYPALGKMLDVATEDWNTAKSKRLFLEYRMAQSKKH